jgi:hypothetical protein
MLPPLLEIYVIWHPDDAAKAEPIAQIIEEHFRGPRFSGLIGGAVDVYVRSTGWLDATDAPRPIGFPDHPIADHLAPARFVALVPVLAARLAAAVRYSGNSWLAYLETLRAEREAAPDAIGTFAVDCRSRSATSPILDRLVGSQRVRAVGSYDEPDHQRICRELAQSIGQWLDPARVLQLKVFISHTKQHGPGETNPPAASGSLVDRVRTVIASTHLDQFFDANSIQIGTDWQQTLRANAAECAMLSIRTDLYATRNWCQEEIRIAKCAGVPIVMVEALREGDERGSFLMDHVPRVPIRPDATDLTAGILRALSLLVDQYLKRVLWSRQQELAERYGLRTEISWWSPHAPEPLTLAHWLAGVDDSVRGASPVSILHPDPPLGPEERRVLDQIAELVGIHGGLDIMTPSMFAARGG